MGTCPIYNQEGHWKCNCPVRTSTSSPSLPSQAKTLLPWTHHQLICPASPLKRIDKAWGLQAPPNYLSKSPMSHWMSQVKLSLSLLTEATYGILPEFSGQCFCSAGSLMGIDSQLTWSPQTGPTSCRFQNFSITHNFSVSQTILYLFLIICSKNSVSLILSAHGGQTPKPTVMCCWISLSPSLLHCQPYSLRHLQSYSCQHITCNSPQTPLTFPISNSP